MRNWKKMYARAKKFYLKGRKPSKIRNVIGGLTIALILMGVVGYAMMAPPPKDAPMPQAQRIAENKKARVELESTAPKSAAVESAAAPAVTLTGCLERHDDDFRLKDAAGADVPKSRSWKSGFLKKHTAAIDVVDGSHRLKLADHVGERVSVTGTLVDREMQVRSLKRVAAGCN